MRIHLLALHAKERFPGQFAALWEQSKDKGFLQGIGPIGLRWEILAGVNILPNAPVPKNIEAMNTETLYAETITRTEAWLECSYGGYRRSVKLDTLPPEVVTWVELLCTETNTRAIARALSARFPHVEFRLR